MIESFIYKFNATECSMKELIQQLKKEEQISQFCKTHSLNLSLLKPLFELSMQGYNNKEIAEKIGVHRITIQRYASILKSLKESEFQRIYLYVLTGDFNEEKDNN